MPKQTIAEAHARRVHADEHLVVGGRPRWYFTDLDHTRKFERVMMAGLVAKREFGAGFPLFITVSTRLAHEMRAAANGRAIDTPAEAGRALAAALRARGTPAALGMVFPFSSGVRFGLRFEARDLALRQPEEQLVLI